MKVSEVILRVITARRAVWVLAAWMGLWMTAAPAVAAVSGCPKVFATNSEVVTTDFTLDVSSPDGHGGHRNEVIFDDRDVIDQEAALTTGLENPQAPDAVGIIRHASSGATIDRGEFRSASFVEPHFLRYGRLLN